MSEEIRYQLPDGGGAAIKIRAAMIERVILVLEKRDDVREKLKEFAAMAVEKFGDRLIYPGDIPWWGCSRMDVDGVPIRYIEDFDLRECELFRRLDVMGYPPEAVLEA